MTDHTACAACAVSMIAAAVVLCAGCSLLPAQAASPAPARHPTPSTAAGNSPTAAGSVPPLAAILPFSPDRLQAAAVLAARFAAADDTWSWRQTPAAWLARLRPGAYAVPGR
jgi:hypothetical protein